MHLDCFKVGITLSKQQPQKQPSLIGWAFNPGKGLSYRGAMGLCLVRGRGGGLQTSSKVYGSSQAGAKVAAGTKGKICRF